MTGQFSIEWVISENRFGFFSFISFWVTCLAALMLNYMIQMHTIYNQGFCVHVWVLMMWFEKKRKKEKR